MWLCTVHACFGIWGWGVCGVWSDGAGAGAELSYVRISSFPHFLFFYFLVPKGRVGGGEGRDLALGFRIFKIFRIICFCLLYLTFRSSFGIGFVFLGELLGR